MLISACVLGVSRVEVRDEMFCHTADVFGGKNSREKKRASAGRAKMRSMILDITGGDRYGG